MHFSYTDWKETIIVIWKRLGSYWKIIEFYLLFLLEFNFEILSGDVKPEIQL